MRPLRIIFVTMADLPEGGGHTSRLRALVQALVVGGHQVQLWNQHGLGTVSEAIQSVTGQIHGAPFYYVLGTTARGHGFGSIATKLRAVRAIARRLRQAAENNAVDVLWFNQLSFYDVYPLSRLARRFRVKTIQAYEDERLEVVSAGRLSFPQQIFGLNARLADRFCPRLADAIVVISRYLRRKYESLARNPAKVHLVPTIVDCAQWDCGPETASTCPVILYAGAFGEQDEIDNLLKAFAVLRTAGRSFRVIMLGENRRDPARMAAVVRQIQELQLGGIVEWKGFIPLAALREQVCQSHILLNIRRPGLWSQSGLSTKLSEYLASGRLVITTDIGDVKLYVRDGESALMVSNGASAEEIARAIEAGLASPERRRAIGSAGQAAARQHFDVSVASSRLEQVLETVWKETA
jgi:glycosyltransferase involved in cell wall biosynthesis